VARDEQDGLIGQVRFRRLELHRDSWVVIEDLTERVTLTGRQNEPEDELQEMKSLERQEVVAFTHSIYLGYIL